MSSDCESCRGTFDLKPQNDKYAEEIDSAHPNCACQKFSLSPYSPGIVDDSEKLYRMIILPGDLDDKEKLTFESIKSTYKNGLSVFRECASDADITNLAEDRLYIKPTQQRRSVKGLIALSAAEVRELDHETIGAPFCIYDQTVQRKFDKSLPHVGTHVGIFQRILAPKTPSRKEKHQQACEVLFEYMKDPTRWIDAEEFRDGFLARLNAASANGAYIYNPV